MSELDPQANDLLAGARRAFSPSAGAKARVLLATRSAIVAGTAVTSTLTGRSAADWFERARTAGALWGVRALAGSVLLASVFGAGYMTARRSSPELARPPLIAPAPSQAVLGPVPSTGTSALPDAIPTPRPVRVAPPKAASAPAPNAEPQASLDEEVRTLKRVERALREHNPRLALALLDELDERVKAGKLVEEREAARVMAKCELIPESAATLAEDFARRYPGSVYGSRVAQMCPSTPKPSAP
jgi:hypothetical protein